MKFTESKRDRKVVGDSDSIMASNVTGGRRYVCYIVYGLQRAETLSRGLAQIRLETARGFKSYKRAVQSAMTNNTSYSSKTYVVTPLTFQILREKKMSASQTRK